MKQTTASPTTPSPKPELQGVGANHSGQSQGSVFITMALDMSWRLVVAVLVPIIGGAELDKHLHSSPALTIVGFVVAMAGMAFVLWQALQAANRLPVPKLTAAEKRAIRKRYEEDDE